jgi:predicted transposase/invertase (TIGR01784 family)
MKKRSQAQAAPTGERYVNPFTDFGFKKLFGSENGKDLLISFLNAILPGQQVAGLTYKKTEHMGATDLDRKVIFDLYCENEAGEKFIVELQKAKQSFFKDRSLFYATFPIQEQAQQGDWDYRLKAVYTVGVLDFVFEDEHSAEVKVLAKLMDTDKKTVFYDKLTFLYLQMPNFHKTEKELETLEDKWFFALRNLHRLQERPARLQEKVFEKLFRLAEVAKFSPVERTAYQDSLKYYRDLKNSLDTSFAEGEQMGVEKGRQEGAYQKSLQVAENCLRSGLSVAQTAQLTGLDLAEVTQIAQRLGF